MSAAIRIDSSAISRAVSGLGPARIAGAHHLRNVTVERLGDDVVITGDLREPPAGVGRGE